MITNLMKGAQPGFQAMCHPPGWTQAESFTQRFQFFLERVSPTFELPMLLTLDGHYCQSRISYTINLSTENHFNILYLPPHLTHMLQHLDKTSMGQ